MSKLTVEFLQKTEFGEVLAFTVPHHNADRLPRPGDFVENLNKFTTTKVLEVRHVYEMDSRGIYGHRSVKVVVE